MKKLFALASGFLIATLFTTAAPSLFSTSDIQVSDEQEGIIRETAAFWIGMPDDINSMPFLNIAPGTKVQVLGSQKSYYRVKHKSLIGFVEHRFVKLVDPDQPEEAIPEAVEVSTLTEKGSAQYRVTKATSLRVQPDSQSRVILRLQPDYRLEVLDDSRKWWWKVRYQGRTGWAKAALLDRD